MWFRQLFVSFLLLAVCIAKTQVVNVFNWNLFNWPTNCSSPSGNMSHSSNAINTTPKAETQNHTLTRATLKGEKFWQVFEGLLMPKCAFLAGTTFRNGKKVGIYIGYVHIPHGQEGPSLQTVAVYDDSETVTVTYKYNEPYVVKENISVLCTNLPPSLVTEFLTWVPSEGAEQYNMPVDFVISGEETNRTTDRRTFMFPGKGTHMDETVIGKVMMRTDSLEFLFSYNDEIVQKKDGFEILAYTKAVKEKNPAEL